MIGTTRTQWENISWIFPHSQTQSELSMMTGRKTQPQFGKFSSVPLSSFPVTLTKDTAFFLGKPPHELHCQLRASLGQIQHKAHRRTQQGIRLKLYPSVQVVPLWPKSVWCCSVLFWWSNPKTPSAGFWFKTVSFTLPTTTKLSRSRLPQHEPWTTNSNMIPGRKQPTTSSV